MDYFVGLDASLETVNLCIVDGDGNVLLEQKVGSEPGCPAALRPPIEADRVGGRPNLVVAVQRIAGGLLSRALP